MLTICNYPSMIEIEVGRHWIISIWKKFNLWEFGFKTYSNSWVLSLGLIEIDYDKDKEPKFDCQRKECPADCTGCYENFYKEESPL